MRLRDAVARTEIGLTPTKALERSRESLGVDEDVGQEGQREDPHEAGVHDRVGRAQEQTEHREHPRQPEREDHDERQRARTPGTPPPGR
jgi:hypothetical protein